jgi:PKD repeat protein
VKPTKNKTWLLLAVVMALAIAACVASIPETVTVVETVEVVEIAEVEKVVEVVAEEEELDRAHTTGQEVGPFDVKEDTQLTGGEHTFSSLRIPSGVTVIVTDDVVINVTGDTHVAGTLSGDCVGIALQGQGDVTITGTIDNQCGEEAEDAKDLLIQTDGGVLTIGTEDSPATLYTSGLLDITNDPSLEEWEFDVLPDQRSEAALPPVCSAQADTIVGIVTPDVPEEVAFYGAGVDPDGGPVTYAWDFGDGQSSTEVEPFHTYQNWGVYDVVLTVTDDDEETCQATLRMVLGDGEENVPGTPGLWVAPLDLVVEAGEEAIFNSDALDPLGQELIYHWDFGDGMTSTEAEPLHTYTEAGHFPVTLTVTSASGTMSTAPASIYVYPTPAVGVTRPPGLARPALGQAEPEKVVLDFTKMKIDAKKGARFSYNTDVEVKGRCKLKDGASATEESAKERDLGRHGRAGQGVKISTKGNLVITSNFRLEAGNGGNGFYDASGRNGMGGRGGYVIITVKGTLMIESNAVITAGDGGKGGSPRVAERVNGGRGGDGGEVTIEAGKQLTIKPGVKITSGTGGAGGDVKAESFSSTKAFAVGGRGGRAGALKVQGKQGIVIEKGGSVTVTVGKGGDGGKAEAAGQDGGDKCTKGGNGTSAEAYGGDGGDVYAALKSGKKANSKSNVPNGPLDIMGGDAGRGGDAIATAGRGGDAKCPNKNKATGGNGGTAEATGGNGGKVSLKITKITNLRVGGPNSKGVFTGGRGGDATASSGRGGHAEAKGQVCGDPAHAVGGSGGNAKEAKGGPGGKGYKVPGHGGDAKVDPGDGGNATATGGTCNVGDCGKDGGNAKAIAGGGGSGLARGGRGAGGDKTNGTASPGAGRGGTAKATGGHGGGGCECPGGRGGNGGEAIAKGGLGALFQSKEKRAAGGGAQATGGNGGRGVSCCDPLDQGGDGGAGGDADASIRLGGVVLKEKGGDGGPGGDGNKPGEGGKGGIPGGNKGNDGKPCPAPTQPATLTPEDVVEQINVAIAEKGYDWQAGTTVIAGLTLEEMRILPETPELVGKVCGEIKELVDQASSSRRLTSPEEIRQSLDAERPLVAEMVVYEDFLYYKGGVYRHAWGDQIGSHAVEIEGYDDAQVCWRVRNSWGTSWGEARGYFRMAYGEAGIEDNVYEIAYMATPTPAPPPTVTPTPAPMGKEYVDECIAYLEQGRALLAEHETGGCTEGLRLLRLAIDRSTTALNLNPNDADAYFCRAMSHRWLEEGLNEAIEDLQSALDLGLAGDRKAEAEQELAKLREKAAAPICVSMGTPIFAEGWRWDEGEPINANTTFPANSTREVWARWTLSNPCNEVGVVKWYHDGVHVCQHDTDELTGEYDGSGWTADEEWIETGEWCVAVYINDVEKTKGCFTVTEQPTPPPSSVAPEILSIEFPSPIPADGTPFDGRLQFKDSEGDINYVSFDVTSGDFSGFGFNPMDFIVEGGVEVGVFLFNMHCNAVQDVTMRVTLYDAAGNSSPPVDFGFSCQ